MDHPIGEVKFIYIEQSKQYSMMNDNENNLRGEMGGGGGGGEGEEGGEKRDTHHYKR